MALVCFFFLSLSQAQAQSYFSTIESEQEEIEEVVPTQYLHRYALIFLNANSPSIEQVTFHNCPESYHRLPYLKHQLRVDAYASGSVTVTNSSQEIVEDAYRARLGGVIVANIPEASWSAGMLYHNYSYKITEPLAPGATGNVNPWGIESLYNRTIPTNHPGNHKIAGSSSLNTPVFHVQIRPDIFVSQSNAESGIVLESLNLPFFIGWVTSTCLY